MSLHGRNFFHNNDVGTALVPQSIASAATVTGPAITEPWNRGRQLSFILLGGAFGATTSLAITVQGLRRDDGTTWEALKQSDGTTNLTFTEANLDDGDAIENGYVLGTVDLADVDSATYEAMRLSVTENGGGANTVLLAAAYSISDLYKRPSGETDDLFSKAHASPAA